MRRRRTKWTRRARADARGGPDRRRRAGWRSAPGRAGHAAATAIGVRALVVPTLIPRTRAAELRHARAASAIRAPDAVIGWYTGSDGSPLHYLDAVADGIARLLADRADVRVEIVGASDRGPVRVAAPRARDADDAGGPSPSSSRAGACTCSRPRSSTASWPTTRASSPRRRYAGGSQHPSFARRGRRPTAMARADLAVANYDDRKRGRPRCSRCSTTSRSACTARHEAGAAGRRPCTRRRGQGDREPVPRLGRSTTGARHEHARAGHGDRAGVRAGSTYTTRCLESVVRHADGHVDAVRAARHRRRVARAGGAPSTSTDFARTSAAVPVTVLHNDENLGFVTHGEPRDFGGPPATS